MAPSIIGATYCNGSIIKVNGYSPRTSLRFTHQRTLPLPNLPLVQQYVQWHPKQDLFFFELMPLEEWMERAGCNTRILHKVFESTGRPPMFWITQQFLRPHSEILDFDLGRQQDRAINHSVALRQQDESGRLSAEQTHPLRASLSSSTDSANLESLQQIVRQMEHDVEQDVDVETTEEQIIELSSSVASDSMLIQSD
jgi:hypothetical protein